MNYEIIYNNLMNKGRNRNVEDGVYYETHHVIPRCLGGSDNNENLVKLTPEEHYLAHLLLVKIHPGNIKLIYAANMMGRVLWMGREIIRYTDGCAESLVKIFLDQTIHCLVKDTLKNGVNKAHYLASITRFMVNLTRKIVSRAYQLLRKEKT